MNAPARVRYSRLVGFDGRVFARNIFCGMGPDHDPSRDVVVITITYHGDLPS